VLNSQALADGALGILNFPIYAISGNAYETRAKIRNQRLEVEALF